MTKFLELKGCKRVHVEIVAREKGSASNSVASVVKATGLVGLVYMKELSTSRIPVSQRQEEHVPMCVYNCVPLPRPPKCPSGLLTKNTGRAVDSCVELGRLSSIVVEESH